jgi:hypothetical protein
MQIRAPLLALLVGSLARAVLAQTAADPAVGNQPVTSAPPPAPSASPAPYTLNTTAPSTAPGEELNPVNPMVSTPQKGDGKGVATPGTTTEARSSSRADSEITAALAEGMPRYAPPKAASTDLMAESEALDARDINKPKNEIKRLPKYVVRQAQPPIFRKRDLYTKDGQTDLAMSKYPGLSLIPPLSFLNRGVAAEMAAEDERLGNISDLKDTAATMGRGGDAAESQFILRETQDTYLRDAGWTWNGPGGGGR